MYLYHFDPFFDISPYGGLKNFLKTIQGPVLGLFGPNTGLHLKKWGVTGVRLSQSNTGQLTLKKKFGISHAKTIENGFDMESTIIYLPLLWKKIPKNLCELFLKSLWSLELDRW
jgi:hypothetical protein